MQVTLSKMMVKQGNPVQYFLKTNDGEIALNDWIGQSIKFEYLQEIRCKKCGAKTKKSFAQGFCFKCFKYAPENSECIIRPELCRGHLGEGRDAAWEEENHNKTHTVYLALTSGYKVGVTKANNELTRWIDQGAWKCIVLATLPYRYLAGQLEVALKEHLSDKTNWQRMLKGAMLLDGDLLQLKKDLKALMPEDLLTYYSDDDQIWELNYPVKNYPLKVKSIIKIVVYDRFSI